MLGLAGFELSGLCHAICRAMQSHRAKNVPHDFSRQLSVKMGQTESIAGSNMVNMHGTHLYMRSDGADPTEIRIFPYFRVLAYMGKNQEKCGETAKKGEDVRHKHVPCNPWGIRSVSGLLNSPGSLV